MLNILGFDLHPYGLILAGAALASLSASLWLAKKRNIPEKLIESGFWWAIISGLIGARLYHVIDLWDELYRANILASLYLWEGGLGIWGGVIGGLVGLWLFHRLKSRQYHLEELLDLGAFGLPLGQAIGRWGNFVNRELYGTTTNLPWAITDAGGNRVHPLFLYESLLSLSLFLILVTLVRRRRAKVGSLWGVYLIGYGVIRFFLETLRPESIVWKLGGLPTAQLVALLAIGVGLRQVVKART